jgi:hypothetical protein
MNTSAWKLTGRLLVTALLVLSTVVLYASQRFEASPTPTNGREVFADTFERDEPGDLYVQGMPDPGHKTSPWRIEPFCAHPHMGSAVDGAERSVAFHVHRALSVDVSLICNRQLVAENIHNAALWLTTSLPEKVRVEFVATALTDSGDLKAEIFGDGLTHQSGYILIMGGWSNQLNIIARQDEHGEDRKRDSRCMIRNRRKVCAEKGKPYRWAIERRDSTVKWFVNGKLFLTFPDKFPIQGKHFGFNNWEAKVAFDDLRIFEL